MICILSSTALDSMIAKNRIANTQIHRANTEGIACSSMSLEIHMNSGIHHPHSSDRFVLAQIPLPRLPIFSHNLRSFSFCISTFCVLASAESNNTFYYCS